MAEPVPTWDQGGGVKGVQLVSLPPAEVLSRLYLAAPELAPAKAAADGYRSTAFFSSAFPQISARSTGHWGRTERIGGGSS